MASILIADDDELVASLASDALIAAGHACGWVTDGLQAERTIDWRRPDLLLLDQDMPNMSGATLLRRLRTSSKHYDLPIIMFTAMSGERDEEQALYAGAQEYVRKPFRAETLIRAVEHVLMKRRHRPRHEDLRTVLEKSAGTWRDPEEEIRSDRRYV
ncbi:phosphate regulon transcriptional regulatory protein [Altererythrobacter epoxidivorans]|uniref:Phosphate regulon transcriptional regulatory protein n=1 Tax=Altererythrobacter epoxidivorans TaxID=361183 RepID=A0A0M5KYC4_9SPHN|nr:response regulator [Altererythrobacter epoxidivorans]ALE16187.1 phosphate regulon transcriptional regulatory protein [Altererythrobacter epoxidivorans]